MRSLLAVFLPLSVLSQAYSAERPNVVVVLADDLGYGDLGCYGNEDIRTPHLDAFAKQGLRLTDCYAAAANCSPARTGLMTGRTPWRVGVHNWIPAFSPMHVRRSEITVATLLRRAGYVTCHVGKWHLNGGLELEDQPQPGDHGFDHWFATQNNALPNHRNPNNFVRNGKPVGPLTGYAADLVAGEAIDWLTDGRDEAKPFFLFVCFHEPHEPIATDERFARLYPSDDPSYSAHHGNISQLDAAFGRLMRVLDEQRLAGDTLVLFTSDNGPAITSIHPHGSAGPLRDKKGSMYEGGLRVPGLVRWPGRVKPGTTSAEPVCGVDLLPTLCAVAGIDPPDDRVLDGTNVLPVLEGGTVERRRPLYWQFNRAKSPAKVAMRVGDWKILATLTGPPLKGPPDLLPEETKVKRTDELDTFALYDLRSDVGETTDLADREPQRLGTMSERLRRVYREVRDASPTWPNWKWPRYESGLIEWPPYRKRRPRRE